jgi:hypothetical protein
MMEKQQGLIVGVCGFFYEVDTTMYSNDDENESDYNDDDGSIVVSWYCIDGQATLGLLERRGNRKGCSHYEVGRLKKNRT